jgi:polysaccharide transporter, PST family
MFKGIRSKIVKEEHEIVASNFFFLTLLNGVNIILPLITIPYLFRVLGVENFGLFMFSQAFVAYFGILISYGFALSATKEISKNQKNIVKLSEIFSSILIIKIFFTIFSFVVMLILIFSFERLNEDRIFHYLMFLSVAGQAFFPNWFFQGIEKMKYISFLTIGSKAFFTMLIFIFIHSPEDVYYVPILNMLGTVTISIIGIWIAYNKFRIRLIIPSKKEALYHLKSGWHIFISSIGTSFYTVFITVILGFFTNNIIVGVYALSEKIIKAIVGMFGPLTQAMYPYFSKRISNSKDDALKALDKVAKVLFILLILLSIFIYFSADWIVAIFTGDNESDSVVILKIFSILPILIVMSHTYGFHGLVNSGHEKAFSSIIIISAFVSLPISLLLIQLYEDVGAAISVTFTEFLISLFLYMYYIKRVRVERKID